MNETSNLFIGACLWISIDGWLRLRCTCSKATNQHVHMSHMRSKRKQTWSQMMER